MTLNEKIQIEKFEDSSKRIQLKNIKNFSNSFNTRENNSIKITKEDILRLKNILEEISDKRMSQKFKFLKSNESIISEAKKTLNYFVNNKEEKYLLKENKVN